MPLAKRVRKSVRRRGEEIGPRARALLRFSWAREITRALEILGGGRKRSFRTGSKNITSSWTPRLRRRYNFVVKLIPTPFVSPVSSLYRDRLSCSSEKNRERERKRDDLKVSEVREREREGVLHEGCRSIDDNDPVDDSSERYYTRLIDAR